MNIQNSKKANPQTFASMGTFAVMGLSVTSCSVTTNGTTDAGTGSGYDAAERIIAQDGSTGSRGLDGGAGSDAAIDVGDGGSSASIAASCQTSGPGLTNCGTSSENCCTSLEIPGGSYYRSYPLNDAGTDAGPAAAATVSGFSLDKYDVTVGRFRQYINYLTSSAGAPPAAGSGKHTHLNKGRGLVNSGSNDAGVSYETGWDAAWDQYIATGPSAVNAWNMVLTTECGQPAFATWTATASNNENRPIDCVNWWASYAFCIWDRGFLPSEAEWEYAAAGGSLQREYPWGWTAPGTGNQYAIYGDGNNGCYYPSASPCTDVTNIAPVGTAAAGAGLWGQLDLAGNVWQWNVDWAAPYVDPCIDCAYLTSTGARIVRGGFGFMAADPVATLFAQFRGASNPVGSAGDGNGFRCARVP